jgi:hypothetical protein
MKTVILDKSAKENYCSIMQGAILDLMGFSGKSEKESFMGILQPDGKIQGCMLDMVSRFSREKLESLLGAKYKKGTAIELADILIHKEIMNYRRIQP